MTVSPASIEIYIDELVLHGFAPGDRYGIGQAVTGELTRLLAAQDYPASFGQSAEVAFLDAGSFRMAQGAGPEAVGAQVAQTIYQKL
jgi:hypothetical protein